MRKQNKLQHLLGLAALLFAVSQPVIAEAKRAKRLAPVLETYSAYDPAQDPDADQSSTFLEPELLESLDPRNRVNVAAALPASPAPLKKSALASSLPSQAKAPPKVVKKAPALVMVDKPPAPVVVEPKVIAKKTMATPAATRVLDTNALRSAVVAASFSAPADRRLMPKKEYQTQSCEAWRGIRDYSLSDKSRADCVTMELAVEFAYAEDWREALPRAIRHGKLSGLRPALAIIVENEGDLLHLAELIQARRENRLKVEIKKVMLPSVSASL